MAKSAVDGQLDLPAGHRLVTLADDPSLDRPMDDHNGSVWAEFMLHDPVAGRHWGSLAEIWPDYQMCLLDADGRIVATHNSAPLWWDGTDAALPDGWDDQFERSIADHAAGRVANTMGALQIVVGPERQGGGLSALMLAAMRAHARVRGFAALIACVRPTLKSRYPLIPIERYVGWRRSDGLPFDPWIRVHARAGGRIVRAVPRSMVISGTATQWESWTGVPMPGSGDYILEGAAAPMTLDRDADRGIYHDPNVWIVHSIDG